MLLAPLSSSAPPSPLLQELLSTNGVEGFSRSVGREETAEFKLSLSESVSLSMSEEAVRVLEVALSTLMVLFLSLATSVDV